MIKYSINKQKKSNLIKKTKKKINNILKHGNFVKKAKFCKIFQENNVKTKISYIINIKITPNNIFCNLKKTQKKSKTLLFLTGGIVKLRISKKNLKYLSKIVLQKFINNITRLTTNKLSVLSISGPIKIRKIIIKHIIKSLKFSKLIIKVNEKKCFNGCRPKKAKRKKRKGLRIRK